MTTKFSWIECEGLGHSHEERPVDRARRLRMASQQRRVLRKAQKRRSQARQMRTDMDVFVNAMKTWPATISKLSKVMEQLGEGMRAKLIELGQTESVRREIHRARLEQTEKRR